MLKNLAKFALFLVLFSPKKVAGSLVFKVSILCFQAYLFSFCTISPGLCVQFRYLLANLRKIYVHGVNITHASQTDRTIERDRA